MENKNNILMSLSKFIHDLKNKVNEGYSSQGIGDWINKEYGKEKLIEFDRYVEELGVQECDVAFEDFQKSTKDKQSTIDLQNPVEDSSNSINTMKKVIAQQDDKINQQNDKIKSLEKKIEDLSKRVENIEYVVEKGKQMEGASLAGAENQGKTLAKASQDEVFGKPKEDKTNSEKDNRLSKDMQKFVDMYNAGDFKKPLKNEEDKAKYVKLSLDETVEALRGKQVKGYESDEKSKSILLKETGGTGSFYGWQIEPNMYAVSPKNVKQIYKESIYKNVYEDFFECTVQNNPLKEYNDKDSFTLQLIKPAIFEKIGDIYQFQERGRIGLAPVK